jgi:hypothetical protein
LCALIHPVDKLKNNKRMRGSNIIILNNSILALRVLLLGFVNVCVAKHFILRRVYILE